MILDRPTHHWYTFDNNGVKYDANSWEYPDLTCRITQIELGEDWVQVSIDVAPTDARIAVPVPYHDELHNVGSIVVARRAFPWYDDQVKDWREPLDSIVKRGRQTWSVLIPLNSDPHEHTRVDHDSILAFELGYLPAETAENITLDYEKSRVTPANGAAWAGDQRYCWTRTKVLEEIFRQAGR